MIGLYTAILLTLMMVNVLAAMFVYWILQDLLMTVWRRITASPKPPWKRNHIGLNHGRTAAHNKTLKIGTLVLPNYKTAL